MAAATFMILAVVLVVLGGWLLIRSLIGDRAKGRLRCPRCWYDMQGAIGLVCPECGHDAGSPTRFHRTRRFPKRILLALVMLLTAFYTHEVARRIGMDHESAAEAMMPTTVLVATYPSKDAAQRRFVIERVTRTRELGAPTWGWQQRWLARRATNAFAADGGVTAVGNDALQALIDLNSRSNIVAPYAVHLLTISAAKRDADVIRLYNIVATVATRTGDLDLVKSLIAGSAHPSEACQASVAIGLLNLPPSLLISLDDSAVEQLARSLWKTKVFHEGDVQLMDRLMLAIVAHPAIAKPVLQSLLADPPPGLRSGSTARTLEVLAVLRRIEGKPAPLQLMVEPSPVVWTPGIELVITARLENKERERPDWVVVQHGGDYRSGRPERWRISVRDNQNTEVHPLPKRTGIGGGISSIHLLDPNRPEEVLLNFAHYVAPLPPGTYTMRVQYHDRLEISDLQTVEGMFFFESEPVKLVVRDK